MIPEGRIWKSYSASSTTTVCPALLPPCNNMNINICAILFLHNSLFHKKEVSRQPVPYQVKQGLRTKAVNLYIQLDATKVAGWQCSRGEVGNERSAGLKRAGWQCSEREADKTGGNVQKGRQIKRIRVR